MIFRVIDEDQGHNMCKKPCLLGIQKKVGTSHVSFLSQLLYPLCFVIPNILKLKL